MELALTTVNLSAPDPVALAGFYERLLGWERQEEQRDWVLLSPLGQEHGVEPLRDSVTPTQRRALAARDLTCTARGCTRPPAMCDATTCTAAQTAARTP